MQITRADDITFASSTMAAILVYMGLRSDLASGSPREVAFAHRLTSRVLGFLKLLRKRLLILELEQQHTEHTGLQAREGLDRQVTYAWDKDLADDCLGSAEAAAAWHERVTMFVRKPAAAATTTTSSSPTLSSLPPSSSPLSSLLSSPLSSPSRAPGLSSSIHSISRVPSSSAWTSPQNLPEHHLHLHLEHQGQQHRSMGGDRGRDRDRDRETSGGSSHTAALLVGVRFLQAHQRPVDMASYVSLVLELEASAHPHAETIRAALGTWHACKVAEQERLTEVMELLAGAETKDLGRCEKGS